MSFVISRNVPSCVFSVLYITKEEERQTPRVPQKWSWNLLLRMNESIRDSPTSRLNMISREFMPGMLTRVVISLSCVHMGTPNDDETCRSMIYKLHQMFRQRIVVAVPRSCSGSCVCNPSRCAIRIACPTYSNIPYLLARGISGVTYADVLVHVLPPYDQLHIDRSRQGPTPP